MSLPPDRRGPHRLLLLFLVATALPAAALVWLGWLFVNQDRQLESARVQERLDSRATEIASAAGRDLAALERDLPAILAGQSPAPSGDALAVRVTAAGVVQHAGAPLVAVLVDAEPAGSPPAGTWLDLERKEIASGGSAAATAGYRRLAESNDPDIRAGSLVRLARVLKRSGEPDRALEIYSTVARMNEGHVDRDPAGFFGSVARIDLLRVLRREAEAKEEADALARNLASGRWVLDRIAYESYAHVLDPLLSRDPARLSLARAVGVAWSEWRQSAKGLAASGRRTVGADDAPTFVTWRADEGGLLVFASTPRSLAEHLLNAADVSDVHVSLVDDGGRTVAGESIVSDDGPTAQIGPVQSGLPWTVRLTAAGIPAEIADAGRTRRAMLTAGLVLLVVLIPATGYLVSRAVRRELAVARQQSNFVSAVSHEFRSPLTSLTHLTSLLRSDFQPTDERRRKYYDVLAHETERLRRFVDTLLDFGRMQAGASKYRLQPTDVAVFVRSVVDEFRRDAASAGRQVSCAIASPVPQVSADADALGRALWNLLENAVKYSPAEAPVEVTVDAPAGSPTVAIRVTDHGAGIPEDEQPHVFEQFYRGASAVDSATRGTGVGLAVVDHIVRSHRGEIQLASRIGEGSTFSVLLPVAEPAAVESARRVS